MTGRRVRVALARSGGIAGVTVRASLDTDELAPEEAESVRRLVERIDLAAAPSAGRHRPDEFQYRLGVICDDVRHEVSMPEHALTPEIRDLVRYVIRRGPRRGA